jgi:hypothetical protein
MIEMNEMAIEPDSASFGGETLRAPITWVNGADDPWDPKAAARGIVAGTILGSAFWAGTLVLVHALLF